MKLLVTKELDRSRDATHAAPASCCNLVSARHFHGKETEVGKRYGGRGNTPNRAEETETRRHRADHVVNTKLSRRTCRSRNENGGYAFVRVVPISCKPSTVWTGCSLKISYYKMSESRRLEVNLDHGAINASPSGRSIYKVTSEV